MGCTRPWLGCRFHETGRPKQPNRGLSSPAPKATRSRFWTAHGYSGNISSAANRWTGRNRGGYINQQVDALLEKLAVTIDPSEALPLHRQLLQEMMNDVAFMPLYFDINSIVMLKGVKGPIGGTSLDWNFFEWDKE